MLGRVVAMLTRLIDRFDPDDSRNVGSQFSSSASSIVLVLVVVLVLDLLARERYHPVGSIGRRASPWVAPDFSTCVLLQRAERQRRIMSTEPE